MVDYSKWDNLDSGDSDSDSDSDSGRRAPAATAATPDPGHNSSKRKGEGAQSTPKEDGKSRLIRAEGLRQRGESCFNSGKFVEATVAYTASLQVLEAPGMQKTDSKIMEAVCETIFRLTEAYVFLNKLREAEIAYTRLLDYTASKGHRTTFADCRTRALYFRGCMRVELGLYEEACSDLRASLAAGVGREERARALLMVAEAGMRVPSCKDPEAKGKELLGEGKGDIAVLHFREAAQRARRRVDAGAGASACRDAAKLPIKSAKGGSSSDAGALEATVVRNTRLQGVAKAVDGDSFLAEEFLKDALQQSRADRDGSHAKPKAGSRKGGEMLEEEGLTLAALGILHDQDGKRPEAEEALREAAAIIDDVIAEASAKEKRMANSTSDKGSSPSTEGDKVTALTRILSGTLFFLGLSLLHLWTQQKAGDETDEDEKAISKSTIGSSITWPKKTKGPPGAGERPVYSSEAARTGINKVLFEATDVLKRASEILKAEDQELSAASPATVPNREVKWAWLHLVGGERRGEMELVQTMAQALDILAEAYARGKQWERACSAQQESLEAWRRMGFRGRAAVQQNLLSLGHLTLELHGIPAGIDDASEWWEQAAVYVVRTTPSEAALILLTIANYYVMAWRSVPSRRDFFEERVLAHYSYAAGLFALERNEKTKSRKKPDATDSASIAELAMHEAVAWAGYAGSVGDDHKAAAKALRKTEELMERVPDSQRGPRWILRKVNVSHGHALALAQGGEYIHAEDKLYDAILYLEKLNVLPGPEKDAHKASMTELFKYVAITRRARRDMWGAMDALDSAEAIGGSESDEPFLNELIRLVAQRTMQAI